MLGYEHGHQGNPERNSAGEHQWNCCRTESLIQVYAEKNYSLASSTWEESRDDAGPYESAFQLPERPAMKKLLHEIRDPIHTFIRLDQDEREVVDSAPVQRLRHIHQLAMSYLLYPASTHKRFEHSLGVMELAGRVYDVITSTASHESIRDLLPSADEQRYWRRVVRMAALCHDVGHLPFSHAAEHELLPDGWDHERLTVEIIRSPEMEKKWGSMTPPLRSLDIVKLAVGPKKCARYAKAGALPNEAENFTDWQAILAEVIIGDAFGVDRMDYLLRDAFHAGVAYGRFDHYRLIDTLRILPKEYEGSKEPALGVEEGGLHSAEALLLARYFMYSQVYFHPIRKVYDVHLQDFLSQWLSKNGDNGRFSTSIEKHLELTDNEVTVAIRSSARNATALGHDPARRIVEHDHFKMVYRPTPEHLRTDREAAKAVFDAMCHKFGAERFRFMSRTPKSGGIIFPVLKKEGDIVSSLEISEVLKNIPDAGFDYVFAEPSVIENAIEWMSKNSEEIIKPRGMEVDDGTTKT